jgi:hypothetical protein
LGTFRGIAAALIRLFSRFLHAGHWGDRIAREQDILHRLAATTLLSCSERLDGRVLRPPEERSGLRARRRFAGAGAAVNLPNPKHIMVEESEEGPNIDVVDQEGRSMFPEGSKEPYERTRRIIEKPAVPLKATPYRISITGHTSASRLPPKAYIVLGISRPTVPKRPGKSSRRPVICQAARSPGTDPLFSEDHCDQLASDHHADARGAARSSRAAALSRRGKVTGVGEFSPWLPAGRKLSNRNSGVFALERFVPSFTLLGDHV